MDDTLKRLHPELSDEQRAAIGRALDALDALDEVLVMGAADSLALKMSQRHVRSLREHLPRIFRAPPAVTAGRRRRANNPTTV